jgi:hypothetical protein
MSAAQIKKIEKEMPKVRTARRMVGVWGALRELVGDPKIEVSGRLILDENDAGQRIMKVRGVKPIRKRGPYGRRPAPTGAEDEAPQNPTSTVR